MKKGDKITNWNQMKKALKGGYNIKHVWAGVTGRIYVDFLNVGNTEIIFFNKSLFNGYVELGQTFTIEETP